MIRSKSNRFRPFIPDFSLRISEDVQILRIRRVHWLAAVRATYFERKQMANGDTPMLNSNGEQIDLLIQELEKVDNVDPSNINGCIAGDITRERTSSLALTVASDGVLENEKVLASHQASSILFSSNKILTDSPMDSGRNTPTSREKQREKLFRSTTIPTPPPPASTNESPSCINNPIT